MMGGTVDMEQKNDFLGRDPIGRLLWRMSLPAIVAQLINLLYNLVDGSISDICRKMGRWHLQGWASACPLS